VAEQFYAFLTSELHAGECSIASRTGRFIPGNNVPITSWTEGQEGPLPMRAFWRRVTISCPSCVLHVHTTISRRCGK